MNQLAKAPLAESVAVEIQASGATFNRVLFQTHGGPGKIWFGSEVLDKETLKTQFASYVGLFPTATRIYFDGCNVAKGGDGTDFLIAAGYVFLQIGGGETFGWVNVGHGLPGWVPFFGGHTIHFGGGDNFKRIRFFARRSVVLDTLVRGQVSCGINTPGVVAASGSRCANVSYWPILLKKTAIATQRYQ